jgi:hypothetical protein
MTVKEAIERYGYKHLRVLHRSHAMSLVVESRSQKMRNISGFRQIHEGTLGSLEVFDLVEDLAARTRALCNFSLRSALS